MANVKCFIKQGANIRPRHLVQSVVERNGTRAADTGMFIFMRGVPITKGDEVYYLQDTATLTNLAGIWNFFDNTRDEGGYQLDAAEDATYGTDATYGDYCDGRVIKFESGTTKAAKIADNPHIKFDGQFDILIWYSSSSGSSTEGGLFSKGDGTTFIQIETLAITGGNNQNIKATVKTPAGIETFGFGQSNASGTHVNVYGNPTGGYKNSKYFHWIRLKRDESGLISLMVDGTVEGSEILTGDASSNDPLWIGADVNGSNIPVCYLSQVRMYCGGYLSDDDYLRIRKARRQPNTMKFGGVAWKIDEQPAFRKVYCKGFAKILHEIEVEPDDSDATWTTGDTDIYKNRYRDKNGLEIIQDLMKVYTGTGTDSIKCVEANVNITGSNKSYQEYTALGSLYTNIVILTLNGTTDSSFSIDSRRILRTEDQDIDHTNSSTSTFSPILFKNGVIKVSDLGYDDSTLVTQLTAKVATRIKKAIVTKAANQFQDYSANMKVFRLGGNTPAGNTSVQITVVQNDGGTPTLTNVTQAFRESGTEPSGNTQFKVIQNGAYTEAVFGADAEHNTDSFTATYDYEPTGDNRYYYTGRQNVSTYGKITKQIYLPQFTQTDTTNSNLNLSNWTSRYLSRFSSLNQRFKIRVPTLVNHIRENYLVKIQDEYHGQEAEVDLMVKNVKYFYPEGITEINCGEHFLDSFDLDAAFGTALSEVRATLPLRSI